MENTKEKKNQYQEDELEYLYSDEEEDLAEEDLSISLAAALNKKKRRESFKLVRRNQMKTMCSNLPLPTSPAQ